MISEAIRICRKVYGSLLSNACERRSFTVVAVGKYLMPGRGCWVGIVIGLLMFTILTSWITSNQSNDDNVMTILLSYGRLVTRLGSIKHSYLASKV